MKATWLAPFVLALAATPALANDMDTDTDNGQVQDGAHQGQMQQNSSQMSTRAADSDANTSNNGQMSSHDDDLKLESDNDHDVGSSHGDMDLSDDTDNDT